MWVPRQTSECNSLSTRSFQVCSDEAGVLVQGAGAHALLEIGPELDPQHCRNPHSGMPGLALFLADS